MEEEEAMSKKNLCSIRLEKNGVKRMRLGGCLYSIRQTNLDRKRDQIHQNVSGSKTGFRRQVDPQVDTMVDLVPGRSTLWSTPRSTWSWAGNFPPSLFWGMNSNFRAVFDSENFWNFEESYLPHTDSDFRKLKLVSKQNFETNAMVYPISLDSYFKN